MLMLAAMFEKPIAAEVTRRRTEARRLRASAGAEWAAAKARFEQELLGQRASDKTNFDQ
jgi:hypothetical protein